MRVMRVHPAFILPAFILPTFLLAACGGSSGGEKVEQPQPATEQPQPAAEQPQPAAGETADQQTARGGELYGKNCAGCHGDAGQGGAKAPPLVGGQALPLEPRPGAKRDARFQTALDVYTWAKAHMPPKAPGSLPDGDYVAILAFALKANGVALDQPLDGERAAAIKLH